MTKNESRRNEERSFRRTECPAGWWVTVGLIIVCKAFGKTLQVGGGRTFSGKTANIVSIRVAARGAEDEPIMLTLTK